MSAPLFVYLYFSDLLHLLVIDVGGVFALVGTRVTTGVSAHVVGIEAGFGIGFGINSLLLSYIVCIICPHNVHRPK